MPEHEEDAAIEGRNPLVQDPPEGPSEIRSVWDRAGGNGDQAAADFIEVPNFPVVRKGFAQEQVREFVSQLSARVRNLERQLEDQRQAQEGTRVIQEEFGNPAALLRRLDELQRDLDETRSARDAAHAEAEQAKGAGAGQVTDLQTELDRVRAQNADIQAQLAHATNELQNRTRQGGGPDGYGAIASQVAEVLRSAGLQAEQVRREAADEADRQIEEARREADGIRREAQADADAFRRQAQAESERVGVERDEVIRAARTEADALKREADDYAAAVRRDAQQEAERLSADRDEVLREARAQAAIMVGEAEATAKRQLDDADRELFRARGDAERMLTAAISRRDLVKSEMLALRERLSGAIGLLDPMVDPEPQSKPAQPDTKLKGGAQEAPADQPELLAEESQTEDEVVA